MSATILCAGCGGRVTIPEDYARGRIRCPECGVMSDVPATAQKRAPAADASRRSPPQGAPDADAEKILLGADPAPPAAAKPARRKPSQAVQAERPRTAEPLHPLPPSPNAQATDEDDGRPYRVPALDEVRPCPQCNRAIARDAVVCTLCGYNLQTGKKAKQEFEPVERSWQGGWQPRLRLGLFIAAEVLFLVTAIIGLVSGTPVFGVFFPFLLFSAMTAFLLGTYDQIHLTRNKKGRVRLTKTWTACFLPRPPQQVDVHDYGGVVYGPIEETSIMEWFILLILLPTIVPAVIWFYFVFVRTSYQVALTKQHGHDELVLYRGGDQAMIIDMAETLREVAHLPKG